MANDSIRKRITHFLFLRLLYRVVLERRPDFIIGGDSAGGPYLRRWWLIPRNRWFNVYLHHFMRDDDDRALHDHPWPWFSLLLSGEYVEHTIAAGGIHHRERRTTGSMKFSLPSRAHRIELRKRGGLPVGCWTLFVTGPVMRQWGFHCPDKGWRHWKEFTAEGKPGEIGPGCD